MELARPCAPINNVPLVMTPAETHGPIENAIRSRVFLPGPCHTSASAEALPVLTVLIGTSEPTSDDNASMPNGHAEQSGSGKDTPIAEGGVPATIASNSRDTSMS